MSTQTFTLKLFGSFRRFGEELKMSGPSGSTIKDLRVTLFETLKDQEPNHNALQKLINTSRFASAQSVLNEEDSAAQEGLAILPPVSGGLS